MRREQPQSGEVHAPRTHGLDERGQPPCGAGYEDAVVRGSLREAELARAEGEHRGERAVEIELAFVDFTEVNEEFGLHRTRAPDEVARRSQELVIAQRRNLMIHARTLAPRFSTAGDACWRIFPDRCWLTAQTSAGLAP